MSKVHDFKVTPLVRLLWASKGSKEYWEPKLKGVQELVRKARIEAYKRGILKTLSLFIHNGIEANLEDGINHGKERFAFSCSPTPHREHKFYYHKLGAGKMHFFTNTDDIFEFSEDFYRDNELSLTLGYSEANLQNFMWFTNKSSNGIIDPSAEMINVDKMNYLLNPFLRHLGLSILPYVAKSWDDEYSINLANQILDVMKEIDAEATKDLISLLEMPTRYSSWRGIADVTTPIFKSYTNTTSYVDKIVVDYEVKMSHYLRSFIPGAPYGTVFPWVTKKNQKAFKEEEA